MQGALQGVSGYQYLLPVKLFVVMQTCRFITPKCNLFSPFLSLYLKNASFYLTQNSYLVRCHVIIKTL